MSHKVIDASKQQEIIINAAHEEAKKIVKRCIAHVEQFELGKKKEDKLFCKYFGAKNESTPPEEIARVAENFRAMHKGLLDATYEYESFSVHTLIGAPEYTVIKGSWKSVIYGKSIHLTSIFFDYRHLQPYVLIHGASHVYAGTDDLASWEDPAKFRALAPALKRNNAYHYDAFAWEIVTGTDLSV